MIISVAAHSEEPSREIAEKARSFVRKVSPCNPTLLLGGYWGLMKTVVDEAIKQGLTVVLILPIERENIDLPAQVIPIRSGCEFRCRSVILVRSGDVLVSLGGGVGTEIEIMLAYAMGKPIYAITETGLSTDHFARAFPEYIDDRRVVKIRYFNDPGEVAEEICRGNMKSVETRFG
ncbi:LOG family protein [Sulfolobus tengchongensis]|uniref:LOG family protein n=1 Tax=Sulfolobus tengchongensis TaxID=207809 RepID=A0AAX4L228_9CREN